MGRTRSGNSLSTANPYVTIGYAAHVCGGCSLVNFHLRSRDTLTSSSVMDIHILHIMYTYVRTYEVYTLVLK